MKRRPDHHLDLRGLELAPPQLHLGIRLVPILRRRAPGDLRLALRGNDANVVQLAGRPDDERLLAYSCTYIPHAFVVSWTDDGSPVAAFGAQLHGKGERVSGRRAAPILHRMVKREGKHQLRMLPLHLAMEGYLALHFGGPEIAWSEYSRRAIRRGLDPRAEEAWSVRAVRGLEEALRIFEIHEEQVGVLVFVAEALATAFVVPHPDDYRRLHRSVLEDFLADVFVTYGTYDAYDQDAGRIDEAAVNSLAELRLGLERLRLDWQKEQWLRGAGFFGADLSSEAVYRAGPFQLRRFLPDFSPDVEHHLGELITRDDGTVEYLKTYRLSAAQAKRAFLLSKLAAHGWNLAATAKALRQSEHDLVLRLERAGFGYLLAAEVLRQARAGARAR